MDLVARIEHWGRTSPWRLAHISPCGQLTYGELLRASDALAAFLQHELPGDRSPVLVVGHKEPEMLIAFLGCAKAGHAYVPIDASLPSHRLRQVIATSEARLTLTPQRVRELATATDRVERIKRSKDEPYYVMFTSGSTGEPKGVTITVECLSSFLEWMLGEHAFGDHNEVFLNQAPFSFDLSVMDTYVSLVTGGTLFSLTAEQVVDPSQLFETLGRSQVTTWVSTPSFAQLCLAERRFDANMLPALRRFLFCGETLPHIVAAQLLERFASAEVWNTYGPTEATVATTSICIDQTVLARYSVLPVGAPKRGSRVLVMGASDEPVADGRRGEIVIAGPNVSPGYLNRPDLTRRSFFTLDGQRAYRTGDHGHFEGGVLFCDGRMDNQVKLHGYRIELGDIEANLRALPGVRDAVVVPLFRQNRIDALAAFVSIEQRPDESDFEQGLRLRRALADRVPAYMVPRVVRPVAGFPMTTNGKVDRRALAAELT